MKTPDKNREATPGSIYPIGDAPLQPGLELLLSPGVDREWEIGEWEPDLAVWTRLCDHESLHPTRWSPLPGKPVPLK